jgi:hypothetical protein
MSKKIDINKVLSTGSAKQRAILLFYHFNLQEAIDKGVEIKGHTLPLTSKEASILFESFKENKDVKVYNEYRILNKEIIQAMRWLLTLVRTFEIQYWKYKAYYLSSKYEAIDHKVQEQILELSEELIIDAYSTALEYYTALKIYIKESGYKDKYVIGAINSLYEYLKGVDWTYKTKNGDIETVQNLVDVEPDEETIKDILKIEFNLQYETEE